MKINQPLSLHPTIYKSHNLFLFFPFSIKKFWLSKGRLLNNL